MKIIFDLDGTLIDSKLRLYALFCFLAPRVSLTFSEYWQRKFSGMSNLNILSDELGCSKFELDNFLSAWMDLIESETYLALDKPIPGVVGFLEAAHARADLYLCTARQYHGRTVDQLKLLGLHDVFIKILVTQQVKSKAELIRSEVGVLSAQDWIIGDMGKDVLVGRELGVSTCAVLTGFMSEERLKEYTPDLMLSSVVDFSTQSNFTFNATK
ncbi:hypothetical protein R50072_19810 [Simiduia litorea]|uniref:HAD family hydrolase n=1 Tax=Simiduia litorea TaxID=1435348 RepID=UPI0036F219BA